jgi:hypothetical protein
MLGIVGSGGSGHAEAEEIAEVRSDPLAQEV